MTGTSTHEFWQTVATTFLASIKSVGTACTLAGVGVYLHQRGFVVGNGKRTLALISQQVTIPLLFFTKILYCNQDWSPEPCPNVTDSLRDVWILLIWPLWVCTCGIGIGCVVTVLAGVPRHQRNSVLASVAFGNSTGLPITLLTVIHSNFGASSALGAVDPTLFLSVYLVLYPVLQWGIGGMLLAPPTSKGETKPRSGKTLSSPNPPENGQPLSLLEIHKGSGIASSMGDASEASDLDESTEMALGSMTKNLAHNVINRQARMPETYQIQHRGLDTTDASLYWSVQENLNRWGKPQYGTAPLASGNYLLGLPGDTDVEEANEGMAPKNALTTLSGNDIGMDLSEEEGETSPATESSALLLADGTKETGTALPRPSIQSTDTSSTANSSMASDEVEQLVATLRKILTRCFQPPVIAALLGLAFASVPAIRGILVDIDDRNGDAPLQWFFDGLYEAGGAAVPINMIILGCNLSASYMLNHAPDGSSVTSGATADHAGNRFSNKTTALVVVGKMIAMPLMGYLSTFVLSQFYTVPHEIAGSLYLVLSIVFLCPTANNVMVMVELSGVKGKESMARIIAYQYAIAPVVLSGTVTGAVLMASAMARHGL